MIGPEDCDREGIPRRDTVGLADEDGGCKDDDKDEAASIVDARLLHSPLHAPEPTDVPKEAESDRDCGPGMLPWRGTIDRGMPFCGGRISSRIGAMDRLGPDGGNRPSPKDGGADTRVSSLEELGGVGAAAPNIGPLLADDDKEEAEAEAEDEEGMDRAEGDRVASAGPDMPAVKDTSLLSGTTRG